VLTYPEPRPKFCRGKGATCLQSENSVLHQKHLVMDTPVNQVVEPIVLGLGIVARYTLEQIKALGKANVIEIKKGKGLFWVCGTLKGPCSHKFILNDSSTWVGCQVADGTIILSSSINVATA
jgi:hypothetical protein